MSDIFEVDEVLEFNEDQFYANLEDHKDAWDQISDSWTDESPSNKGEDINAK